MLLRFYKGRQAPLRSCFKKMSRDHLWNTVFPSMGVMTIAEWEEYFSDKWIIAMMDRKTGVQTFAWIWDMKGPAGERMASGGFIAFREIWGMRAVSRAVRMSADEFIRVFELKVLHGLIRADNSLARRFAQEIGFKEVAVIPNYIVYRGKLIDGVLVSRTRNGRR